MLRVQACCRLPTPERFSHSHATAASRPDILGVVFRHNLGQRHGVAPENSLLVQLSNVRPGAQLATIEDKRIFHGNELVHSDEGVRRGHQGQPKKNVQHLQLHSVHRSVHMPMRLPACCHCDVIHWEAATSRCVAATAGMGCCESKGGAPTGSPGCKPLQSGRNLLIH